MARYGAETKMSPEKVIDLATKHFAAVSAGLKVTSKTENSLCLESPEGYVTISACKSEEKGKKTHIELESKEYDFQVTEFLRSL
jgi:hypothetical protein